jgi:hypothetical protein
MKQGRKDEAMANFVIAFLVAGLEILCLFFGAVLFNTEAPQNVWRLWAWALGTIPVTGIGAVWLASRRSRMVGARKRVLGGIGSLFGLLASVVWIVPVITYKREAGAMMGSVIASLAFIPALYLLSAGLILFFSPDRPANSTPLSSP